VFDSAPKRKADPRNAQIGGVQRNLFFVIFSLIAVAGCGGSRSPVQSTAAAAPPAPEPPAGTSTGAGAVQPDAGPPPDCSANAPFDARCFDPGAPSVTVTQSDAAQCAAFLPVTIPEPVLFTRTFLGPGMGVWNCGATPDGDGHLGVCMYSDFAVPADGSTTRVMTADGATLATLPGQIVRSEQHGFLTLLGAVDYGQSTILTGWNGGTANGLRLGTILPSTVQPDPPFCSWAASDSGVTAACWSAGEGASLRHFDASLAETAAPVPLPEKLAVAGFDEQGRMLATNVADETTWRNADGSLVSGPIAGPVPGPLRPLVGGGYDTPGGVLLSGATRFVPRPQWLAARADGPLALVRGRGAYAYVPPNSSDPCTSRLEVLAPDGTVCATVTIAEPQCSPGGPVTGPALRIGAAGSVAERAGWYCQDGTCLVAFRVWNHLLD